MKKLTLLIAAAALCLDAPAARAAWEYSGEITVAAGQITASDTAVLRGGESATNYLSAIDSAAAYNASGGGTGAVSFALAGISGAAASVWASSNLPPGSAHADWPARAYAVGAAGVTNAASAPWYARYVTVSVTQTATNSAVPTVYRWRIGTR